ncbi:hypothetical protein BJX63DRAFT_416416 [Aspergillus granulosus]|uniref:Uncharacterized protein n=1 Tax=Aspergillus granulosus TaxID=176169 RepID=A0ABR4GS07_9EURO
MDLNSDGLISNGSQQMPQISAPIQDRDNELQRNLRQSENAVESCKVFAKMLRETRRSTAKASQTAEKLSDVVKQLNELRKEVVRLEDKVSQLEERCNEDHRCVDNMISSLKTYQGLYRYLVQRLSIPIGFDEKPGDPVINRDIEDCM